MSLIYELREWGMFLMEAGILIVVWMEYNYDRDKDEAKKQRKTRTTKKTTQSKDGSSTTEESIETTEPVEEKK